MESASSGLISALSVVSKIKGQAVLELPKFSMIGALCGYISDSTVEKFQPMGANFGVLPPLQQSIRDKKERYMALSQRSVNWFDNLGKDE